MMKVETKQRRKQQKMETMQGWRKQKMKMHITSKETKDRM